MILAYRNVRSDFDGVVVRRGKSVLRSLKNVRYGGYA
jgi:hypothetical protein